MGGAYDREVLVQQQCSVMHVMHRLQVSTVTIEGQTPGLIGTNDHRVRYRLNLSA